MTVRVLMLRRDGVRLPDGQSDSRWIRGTITLDGKWTRSNVYRRVYLRYPGDTHVMEPRHELFEPTLCTL